MLNPTCVVENDFNEDCSSGSESGSEVSLEPETDRFGFIVTTGSTAMCTGPHPQVVRQREAKWISIMEHWECISVKKTNKSLDTQPALQNWVDVIERDLDRQFPFHEMFLSKDGHGQRNLFRVLKAYTQYQPKEGYCQAQGPVAAVLLMNMPAEEAFWCLVQISDQYLPGYYSPLLEGVLFDADMLTWVLKRMCPSAHKHLQHHGVEPLMFATDWLMCLFTRHLPFNILLRVWDLFFCHGVRVLLQVGVVLVRRVLGRAEQRKQCQGQMETLERLRGVKNEVQDEDDAFIAEVCSVPLSASDLEKQTEKTLEKWRKDRPLSTFDPRGRCQGYQMLWARAKHNKEERDVKEREKGNLSVPLARSASALSLSPSRLHWRWRKGEKVNTREWDSGRRVMRHLSIGAKDDWRSWNDLNFKGVQCVQEEDAAPKQLKKLNKLTGQNRAEEKEGLEENQKMFKGHNIIMHHTEITEKDGSQKTDSEAQMTELIDNSAEDRTVKTESSQSPAEALVVENITEHMSHHEQERVRLQSRETVRINSQEKTEQQLVVGIQENQSDANTEVEVKMKEGVNTSCDVTDVKSEKTENVLQMEEDVDVPIETELPVSSELIGNTREAQLQQNKSDVIVETEETSQGDTLEADSSVEHDEEFYTPAERDVLSQTEDDGEINKLDKTAADVQTDAFPLKDDKTLSQQGSQHKERNEAEAAQPEALPGGSEKKIHTTAEGKQWSEGIILTGGSEVQVDTRNCDQTQVETPAGTQMDVEAGEKTSQAARHLTARPDGKKCPVEVRSTEQRAQEQPGCQGTEGPEGERVSNSISSEATDNHTRSMEKIQNTDECHLEKVHTEQRNSRQTQVSGHSSSRSSVEVCVQRSSASRGSRLARRLSEDVFVHPQRTNQSSNPGRLNPTDGTPVPPSVEQTSEPPVLHKHFSLFRRLKGEQPKKMKTKGTAKMQVPKILIQDFSDKLVQEEEVSSKEKRRTRRERERKEREEETLRKKRDKELKKEREQERKKPQRKDRSFFGQRRKDRGGVPPSADTQMIQLPAPYAESYF